MANDQTLSHFRILDRIGSTGMGAVFRAEDLSLRRKVALKFLLAEAGVTADQRARFLREARTAAALNHPNICTIHEVGEVEEDTTVTRASGVTHIPAETPFLSMELIEGETLRERLERSPRSPLAELMNIAVQVAEGLAAAHSCRIVHRDLKPGNVMVTPSGRVKILDFGFARPTRPLRQEDALDATQTFSGESPLSAQAVDTFSYMSPEQAEGRPPIDSRSDVFSYGTLLYEMAAGKNPFAADSPTKTMARVLETEPAPLAKLRPDIPRCLAEIIERCLQKKPEDRYADTRELAKELREIQAGIRTSELKRWRRRPAKRVFALATVTVLAVLTALTVYLTRTDKGGPPERATPSANRVAIFPFTVQGAEHFAYLSEGIVDLIGALLDGAGDLQTVDPFALAHRMKSEGIQVADESNGQRLAEQMDASLYLLGSIVEMEGQLETTCSLYQIAGGPPTTARASVIEESQLYELVESLVRSLLADRTDRADLGLDLAAETTGSIDALKEYLRGESFRREGDIAAAIDAHRRAVETDSTFALAWYALSYACAHPSFESETGREASARAMELRAALPPRERLLIEALDAWSRGAFEETERCYRAVLEIDTHCARAWYGLGENLFHSAHLRGRSPEEAHRLMVRAIEEGMTQDHPTTVGMYEAAAGMAGEREEVVKWVRRSMQIDDWAAAPMELAFLEGDERAWRRACAELAEAARRADDTAAFFLFAAPLVDLQAWVDARLLEASTQTIRAALESVGRPSGVRAAFRISLAHLELAQGRLAAGRAELERARTLDPAATLEHEALIAVGPVAAATSEELEALRDSLLAWDAENIQPALQPNPYICPHDSWHPELRRYLLGLLSIRLEDFESAARYMQELESSATTPDEIAAAAAFTGSIRAHLAVVYGDTAAALDELQSMTFGPWWELTWSTPFFSRSLDRYLLADLLDARGQSHEALLWFGGVPYQSGQDFDYLAPCHRRHGEILERLGRTEEALEQYRRFLDLWQNCDAKLQTQCNDVKTRVEALAGAS